MSVQDWKEQTSERDEGASLFPPFFDPIIFAPLRPRRPPSQKEKKPTRRIKIIKKAEAEVAELRAELSPPPSIPPEQHQTSTSPASPAGAITLRYSSGWPEAFVHFSRDGRAWTPVPGLKLVEVSSSGGSSSSPAAASGDRELRIEGAKRLFFVMTDGHGNWDTPVPSYASDGSDSDGSRKAPSHYSIEEPGTWRLKSGKLTKLD